MSLRIEDKADLLNGKVLLSQLPSPVIIEVGLVSQLPLTGAPSTIYIITTGVDVTKQFRWDGTVYVPIVDNLKANIASPAFTGIPTAITALPGTSTTQLATTAFVTAATVPAFNPFNVSAAIRAIVVQGTYNDSGELQGTEPVNSIQGYWFSYGAFSYTFMPGDAGNNVWIRNKKTGAAVTQVSLATIAKAGIVKIGSGVNVAIDGTISIPVSPVINSYSVTGQATDGYMTQKATTDALNTRFNNRGEWVANRLYYPNDLIRHNEFSYYYSGNYAYSSAIFYQFEWVSLGLNEYYVNKLLKIAFMKISSISLVTETTVPQVANTTGQSFYAQGNRSYFFTMGGEITMKRGYDPDPVYEGYDVFGQTVSVRLKKFQTKPLLIKTIGNYYVKDFIIAPGETVVFAFIDVNTSVIQYPGEYGGDGGFVLISRSGGEVITEIQPAPFTGIVSVDFLSPVTSTINANSNLVYNPSVNIAIGPVNDAAVIGTQVHYITNTSTAEITLTFPSGWTFLSGSVPTKLGAGKQAILTVKSLGNSDSFVKAIYTSQDTSSSSSGSGSSTYALPQSTSMVLGGIKLGANLTFNSTTGQVDAGASTPLYKMTGQNEDAAMTQKATSDALATKASTDDLTTLSNTVAAHAAPISVQTVTSRVGYATMDAALSASAISGLYMTLNTAGTAITVSNPLVRGKTRWPCFFDAAGASIVVSDGITVTLGFASAGQLLIRNGIFQKQSIVIGVVSTSILLIGPPPNGYIPGANQAAQFLDCFSQVPIQMQGGELTLDNGYFVSVIGTGTLYLYGSATVDAIASGITVVDKRPGAGGAASSGGGVTQAYVDAADTALGNKITTNTNNINALTTTKAPIDSPNLIGIATVPTVATTTVNTQIANTQFVANYVTANPTTVSNATATTTGVVKIGRGLNVAIDGTISAVVFTPYTDVLAINAVIPLFTNGINRGINFTYNSSTSKLSAIVDIQIPSVLPYASFASDIIVNTNYLGYLFSSESIFPVECRISPDTAAAPFSFPLYTYIHLQKTAAGDVTIVGIPDGANAAPIVLVSPGSSLVLTQINERRTLHKIAPNTWLVLGLAATNINTGISIVSNTSIVFNKDAEYTPITTGTYTLNTTTKVVGACVRAYVGIGATAITIPASGFQKMTSAAFDSTKENIYSFCVGANGSIQYYINQPI